MPDAEELAQHEQYLQWAATKQFWTPDERVDHQAYMAGRSWAEKDRQAKSAARRQGRGRPRIRASRREALMMGYCGNCRAEPLKVKPNGDAYSACEKCYEYAKANRLRRYAQRKKDGNCARCTSRRAIKGQVLCEHCAELNRVAKSGGKPRKYNRVQVGEDDGLVRKRNQDADNIWDAHREAINVLIRLGNARPDDPELRRAVRALYASGALLAEEVL